MPQVSLSSVDSICSCVSNWALTHAENSKPLELPRDLQQGDPKPSLELNRDKAPKFGTRCSVPHYNGICCNRFSSVTEE